MNTVTEFNEKAWPFVPIKSAVFDEMEVVRAKGVYLIPAPDGKFLMHPPVRWSAILAGAERKWPSRQVLRCRG